MRGLSTRKTKALDGASPAEGAARSGDEAGGGSPGPTLTAALADSVRFNVAEPQGYFFPQVEEFTRQTVESLRWHENRLHGADQELHASRVETDRLSYENQRLRTQIELFRVNGDPVVNADGSYRRESQVQDEAPQDPSQAAQVAALEESLAVAQAEVATTHQRLSALDGELVAQRQWGESVAAELEQAHSQVASLQATSVPREHLAQVESDLAQARHDLALAQANEAEAARLVAAMTEDVETWRLRALASEDAASAAAPGVLEGGTAAAGVDPRAVVDTDGVAPLRALTPDDDDLGQVLDAEDTSEGTSEYGDVQPGPEVAATVDLAPEDPTVEDLAPTDTGTDLPALAPLPPVSPRYAAVSATPSPAAVDATPAHDVHDVHDVHDEDVQETQEVQEVAGYPTQDDSGTGSADVADPQVADHQPTSTTLGAPQPQGQGPEEGDVLADVIVPFTSELPEGTSLPRTGEAANTYRSATPGTPLGHGQVPVMIWAPELNPANTQHESEFEGDDLDYDDD